MRLNSSNTWFGVESTDQRLINSKIFILFFWGHNEYKIVFSIFVTQGKSGHYNIWRFTSWFLVCNVDKNLLWSLEMPAKVTVDSLPIYDIYMLIIHWLLFGKRSFYTFEDIGLWESHAKVHKKPSETVGVDSILRLEISIYCLPWIFNWLLLYFAQCLFTEVKRYIY